MPEDTFLMGMQITKRNKDFVYIVTTQAEGENMVHSRMPLVVSTDKRPMEFDAGGDESEFEQQRLF